MTYALLGIRGLLGGAFSRGIDKVLEPFAETASFYRVTAWNAAEDEFAFLAGFNGPIIIVIHSMGWVPVVKHLNKYLTGKDVWLFTLDPARIGFDGVYPLVTPLDEHRHLNIWQVLDVPQNFGAVEGAENIKWHEPGHSALDDREGVQAILRARIAAIVGGAFPQKPKEPIMVKPFYMGEVIRLDDGALAATAAEYDLPEYLLRALIEIEAGGRGVHSSGAIVARYEPHIAWRHSSGMVRDALAKAGVAYSGWRKGYPKGSPYPLIDKCTMIAGPEVAALSTSWGIGQVMGFNHVACGHESALAMVQAMARGGEPEQLRCMMSFIRSKKLLDNLQREDWTGFAIGYNGAGQASHSYDKRFAEAAARWKKRLADRVPANPGQPQIRPVDTSDIDVFFDTQTPWLDMQGRAVVKALALYADWRRGVALPLPQVAGLSTEPKGNEPMKSFLKSKTIWGVATMVIANVLPTLLPVLGYEFTTTDAQELLTAIQTLMESAGAVLAIYGRVVAKDAITFIKA